VAALASAVWIYVLRQSTDLGTNACMDISKAARVDKEFQIDFRANRSGDIYLCIPPANIAAKARMLGRVCMSGCPGLCCLDLC
jgi:hypothetical protein